MNSRISPNMIILAREARGMTQRELADRLSISSSKMSKIEAGFLSVNSELLLKIAKELRFPEHLFSLTEDIYGLGLSGLGLIYYRRRQSISMKMLNKIQAQMNIRRFHISKLLRTLELENKRDMPFIDIDEYDGDATKIAAAVRASWRVPSGPIRNLTDLIESAGGIVIKCDFETDKIDALSQPGMPPLFFINDRTLGDRLRFSLAHELGHIVMHKMPTERMEEEANEFASEFLMPKQDISSQLSCVDLRKLATLKPLWKVAMAALLYRAYQLGKMTRRKYQYLWTQMATYRKREPSELDIPIEEPKLIGNIIDTYLNSLKYNISELSELLLLCEAETRTLYISNRRTSHLTVIK
jgi:Zn-dependent peptidase ImmA (M78 family)/DNA-binding XRE family transcriptional regulator